MDKSSFQFSNPSLTRLSFILNESFEKEGELSMGIHMNARVLPIEKAEDDSFQEAEVSVTLCIGTKDETTPFYIEAEEMAAFRWEKDAYSEEQVDTLLNQNAVALLISYLRPIIAGITAASPYPTYNLPYINLTSSKKG